jgi:hypothetical protein
MRLLYMVLWYTKRKNYVYNLWSWLHVVAIGFDVVVVFAFAYSSRLNTAKL